MMLFANPVNHLVCVTYKNVHQDCPFECLKIVRLPFAIVIRDRWDAVQMDWIIHSEKILVIRTAGIIH